MPGFRNPARMSLRSRILVALVALILKNAQEIIKTIAKEDRYTLIIKDPNVLMLHFEELTPRIVVKRKAPFAPTHRS